MGESHILDDELPRDGAGASLRRGREAAGLDLADIAEITKIPERHLQTMEKGQFADLPARAYAVGFARTYAKAVGLDEREIAERVRGELDEASADQAWVRPSSFEAGDPARIPSSRLSWVAAGLAVAVILAGVLFWRSFYSPAAELPPIVAEAPEIPNGTPTAVTAEAAAGQVVFTATSPDVWVRLYDANGSRLFEKSLALGESFEVPADAEGPLLWTGRPEALSVTVGGRPVSRLAENQQTMKDVPVSAEALLNRPTAAPTPVAQGDGAALARNSPPRAPRAAPAPAPRAVAAPPEPPLQTAAESEAVADNP
jgi:cytoskeleton protein RodZ